MVLYAMQTHDAEAYLRTPALSNAVVGDVRAGPCMVLNALSAVTTVSRPPAPLLLCNSTQVQRPRQHFVACRGASLHRSGHAPCPAVKLL